MDLKIKQITGEIIKEEECMDFLSKLIEIHIQAKRYDLVVARSRDLALSAERLKRLDDRKRFYLRISKLANQGILTEVVKKYEAI